MGSRKHGEFKERTTGTPLRTRQANQPMIDLMKKQLEGVRSSDIPFAIHEGRRPESSFIANPDPFCFESLSRQTLLQYPGGDTT
jgi:hypothetical protein